MRKFTFLLFSLLAVCSYGQVAIDEDYDSGTPAGWTDSYSNTTSQVCAGQSERDNLYSGSASGNMTSPNQVGASNGTDITFSIDYKVVDWSAATTATADGWGSADLQYSTDDGTNWITAGTIDDSNDSNSNVCTTFSVTILGASVPTSSDLRFRVLNTWAAGDYYFYIDDFYANQVAACPAPTVLVIDSFTDTTAEISWTAGGSETDWEIAVQLDGTGTPGSGTATTSNPYSATGLTAETAYEVYVRADCGGSGTSLWVGPVDFTTPCAIITPDYTADMSTNVPDACWDEANDGEVAAGHSGSGTSDWTSGSYVVGTSNRINLYDNVDREWLLSPAFDLSADGYELIVNVGVTNWNSSTVADVMGSDDEVQLLMSTDGGTTWSNLTTWTVADALQPSGTEYTEDLTGTTGTDVQFAIWASDGTVNDTEDYDFHVGTFVVRAIPACPDITGLTIDSFTAETAEISWTAGGSETDWEIAVQADGTGTPGSGTATTSNPYSETGLTELTAYEVYVRSDCGGGQLGAWVGPVDFTTTALCPDVSGIAIDSFTSDSVTVSWTAGASETDWEIAVQADGTGTPGSGTSTATNPHTESGLSEQTDYEVYVRADCTGAGNGYSTWVGPVDFTTSCTAITPDYTADMTTNVPDACWDEATNGEVAAGPTGLGSSSWSSSGTGDDNNYGTGIYSNRLNIYGTTAIRDWLISPTFDLSSGGPYELVMNVAVTNYNDGDTDDTMGADDEVQLLVSTDGGTTWVNLTTWNVGNEPDFTGTDYTEDLTAYSGNAQFAIWGSNGTVTGQDYDFHVGQFVVREIPACPDVSAVMVSNITTTTVDVAWTNGGSETAWEVAIQAQGTGTPGGAGAASATNPYNATGLTAQTDYEVYVRADCGGGDLSNWIGPINFSTACDTFVLPLIEGFESGVPPVCWSSFRGTNGEGTGYDWTTSGTANTGSNSASVRYENVANSAQDWLVTPAMDFSSATAPELSFYARESFSTEYNSVHSIQVSTTDTNIASFTSVQSYTEADFSNTTFEQFVVDLAAYAGQSTVYIAFVMENDDGDSWFVDDVLVYDNVPTTFTYTAGTWAPFNPMGIASSDDDVVIATGDATMDSDLSCNSMTVNPGAGLTVDTGATLTTVAGTALESSSTSYSSLILDGTVAGGMTYERHINMNGSGTTGSNDLVSAPLTGQAFNTFAAANPNILNNGTLYLFGPFEKNTGLYVNWEGTETSTLDPGVGYRTGSNDNGSYIFTGTANNGTVTNDIVNGGTNNEEWNLIGNPYPSYLNVQDFLNHDVGGGTTNIQLFDTPTAAIYGYDGNALNGWTIYNLATTTASTVITPGQGFMVSANAANTGAFDIEFTPDMRRTGSGDDFIAGRNAALTYLTLNVSANDKSYNTDLYFNANASQGFDVGYDAGIWGDTAPDFGIYSHLVQDNVGQPMALQALNATNLTDITIPLGVNANQGEQITFSIADMTLPTSVNVYLEDVVKNTVTLLNNSDYVITPTTALSGTGRFFLRTSEGALSNIENSLDKLDVFTLQASDELVVSGELLGNSMLTLYDIQGRLVLSYKLDHTLLQNRIDVSSINSGVYIVIVGDNGQEKTKKVIID